MKLAFLEKRKEAGDCATFIFEPHSPIQWKAGQFLFYTFPHSNVDDRGVTRYFTISSAPFEKNIHITTRISDERSSFKNALNNLKPGQEIEATDPDGDFTMEDSLGPTQNHIFISGGIGITPYYSILKDLDHKNLPINITLLYANSNQDFVFKEELEKLSKKHPNFKIKFFVSPRHIEKEDIIQTIDEIGNNPTIWFSGPEKMTEAFEIILKKDLKIAEERTKFDYFPGYDIIN